MRLFAYIFLLIVTVLNFVPCADRHEFVETTAVQLVSTADSHEHSAVEDGCTPFCHCSCCAASVVMKLQSSLAIPFSFQQEINSIRLHVDPIEISLSVWQPPKLS